MPIHSLNAHQHANQLACDEMEKCSYIILHCYENSWDPAHELPRSVETLLDPKISLGAILLLLFVVVFASSLLLVQVPFCPASPCWALLLLTSTSTSVYPLRILPTTSSTGSTCAVYSTATLHVAPWVGFPDHPCFFHPLCPWLAILLQTPILQSCHWTIVQLLLLTD